MSEAQEIEFDPPDEYDAEIALEPSADLAFEQAVKLRRKALTVTEPKKTVVLTNGKNMLARPVPMEPFTDMAILNNLVCREEINPSGELPPPSPTITGLQNVMDAIARGEDIAPYKENIERVLANQPEKGELIGSYINQANKEALADMVVMRAGSLRVIKQATARTDLSMSEALVVWRMTSDQIAALNKGIGTDEKPVDGAHVVEKIDYNKTKVERDVARRWEGTTPQGRELIRKKLWEVERAEQAKRGIQPSGTTPVEPPENPEDAQPFDLPATPPEVTLAHPK